MPSITVRGAKHAYTLTAPTTAEFSLVFLHGWLLSRAYWEPPIAQLQATYQCLTYDLRGFGQSELGTCDRFTPESYAEDLCALLDALNLSRVWLIGHSLGGIIALWAAQLLGDRACGVVCLNAGGGIYLKEEFEKFRRAGQWLLRLRPRWLPYIPTLDRQFARDSVKMPLARRWGRQRLIDFAIAKYPAARGTLLDSTSPEEVRRLPQIVANLKQPAYFIAGADDRIMEPKYVRHLASFHPASRGGGENAIELPDCGHMGMLEQTDRLVAALRQILTYNRIDATSQEIGNFL